MKNELATAVAAAATETSRGDGCVSPRISAADVTAIADRLKISLRKVELAALEGGIVPQRYSRNMTLLSPGDQARLLTSAVAIIGLGGLGGTVVEILARSGVGRLHLVDGDRFDESNLNRQLLCREKDRGRAKAARAAERIAQINPAVDVVAYPAFFRSLEDPGLPSDVEVIIDCLDNVPDRFRLEAAAGAMGIPLVSAAVAGMAGQLTVIHPGDRGLEQVYGDPAGAPATGAETILGTMAPAVTLLGALECSECIKLLLGRSGSLRNRMMLIDLWDNSFEIMALS